MNSKLGVLCGLLFIQGAWCAPVTTTSSQSDATSYGTQFADEMNKSMTTARERLKQGFSRLASAPIKFTIDTAPSLLNLGIHTAADKAVKISEANKEAFGKFTSGLSHTLGGGAVLGGSVAGGALEVIGGGLSAGNNVVEAAAKAGIELAGKMADNKADLIKVAGTISNSALNAVGDGISTVAGGVNVFSKSLSGILDAIGVRMAQGINKAQTMAAEVMGNGALNLEKSAMTMTTNALTNYYKAMTSLLQVMVNMQGLFDSAIASINPAGTVATPSSTTTAGTTTSGITTAGTTSAGTTTSGTTATGTTAAGTTASTSKSISSSTSGITING